MRRAVKKRDVNGRPVAHSYDRSWRAATLGVGGGDRRVVWGKGSNSQEGPVCMMCWATAPSSTTAGRRRKQRRDGKEARPGD